MKLSQTTRWLAGLLLLAANYNAQAAEHQCNGPTAAELIEHASQDLLPIQQKLLTQLAARHARQDFPMAVCFAPDTPPDVIDRHRALRVATFRIDPASPRWTATATDGGGIQRGSPITLTWSFIPDGTTIDGYNEEPAAPSDLIAFLNGIYGSQATWLPIFQQVFDRWSELSGITYVYEANDDGALFAESDGALGVRGDIRIGGHYIDGNSGVLAYNFFPDYGDMVIDTADNFFSDTSNNSIRMKNVLAHEAGHGLGFDHVCPVNNTKLMEPFASTAFNGPQHDDILAVQRNYGDDLGNNNTAAAATSLGSLGTQTITRTNLSIDGIGELDYFKFTVLSANRTATVTLAPVGFTYLEGSQNGDGSCSSGTSFNSKTINNLAVELLDSNGVTVMAVANSNPAGVNEVLNNVILTGTGPYYIRVSGASVDNVQMYTLTVTIGAPASLAAPVLVAEPATTLGSKNTISWNPVSPAGIAAAATEPSKKAVRGGSYGDNTSTATLADVRSTPTPAHRIKRVQKASVSSEEIKNAPSPFIAPLWQGIFSETFEGAFPGANWALYGSPTWDDESASAHGGSWSGWCAGSSLSPAGGYPDDMEAWMVYGPFSLADATSARMNFWFKNQSEEGFDTLGWYYSTDDYDYYGFEVSGDQNSWQSQTLDLASVVGQTQVWIAFIFMSDESVSGLGGAFVDDVVIEKDVPSGPDLATYQPANWNSIIPINPTQLGINDPHTYSGAYYDNQTLYFNWASANQGYSSSGSYTVRAEVTGTGGGTWTWTVPAQATNTWHGSAVDQPVGPLSLGSHTFRIWIDYDNIVSESSEANNFFERTIEVVAAPVIEYFAESANNSGFLSPTTSGWILPTQHTFTNRTPGQTYWYRVKARQSALESPWSNVVSSQQVPFTNPTFQLAELANGNFSFSIQGDAGVNYMLQYSSDLITWTDLALVTNVTGTAAYTDLSITNSPTRFYRSFPVE